PGNPRPAGRQPRRGQARGRRVADPPPGPGHAPRPALGLPGWPVAAGGLAPYYARAMPHLEVGPNRFDGQPWRDLGEAFDAFDPARLALTFWERSPPTRFGERYRDELSTSPRIRVLLGANLTGVRLEPDGASVRHLDLASLGGRRTRLKARRYVLACGGIENARLLLASDDVVPEGVGNRHGLVGRHFMEHPQFEVAQVFPADTFAFLDRYYRRRDGGRFHRIGWQLPPAAQDASGCANHAAEILIEAGRGGAADRASALLGEVAGGRIPEDLDRRVLEVLADLGGVAQGAWRKYALGREVNKLPRALTLHVTLDPVPDPESRVTLGEERDALGMRRAVLDWRLSPADGRGVGILARAIAAELGRLELGRVRLHQALEDEEDGAWIRRPNLIGHGENPGAPPMHVSWHHMGTTRMAADPGRGVVDADCRVHGVADLYVAGSSVFPSTGNANPTLTIVALAVRLADHLKGRLAA
ncbi:MAG TPA: GMC oxidoreductase, partial [Geminicoccaceae bacterium]